MSESKVIIENTDQIAAWVSALMEDYIDHLEKVHNINKSDAESKLFDLMHKYYAIILDKQRDRANPSTH